MPMRALREVRWPDLVVLGSLFLLANVAHGAAIGAFFSPDDLVHLEQAAGLAPVHPTPFRFLSQVLYFRIVTAVAGLSPIVFHAISLSFHAVNGFLVFAIGRRLGVARPAAWVGASLFVSFPLFFPILSSAVGMNDELSLMCLILALLAVSCDGRGWMFVAGLSFSLAVLCKESVIAMPGMALALVPRERRARVLPLVGLAGLFLFLLVLYPPQGAGSYAVGTGSNLFHNLMTYTAWAINLTHPLPDLVSSFDPGAWRVGLWVYVGLLVSWAALPGDRRLIASGAAWWLCGLLPVLFLRDQTYRQYLYPALPGLALIAGIVLTRLVSFVLAVQRDSTDEASSWRPAMASAVLVATVVGYAVQAHELVAARRAARVPGTLLALDPVTRREEIAANALTSLASTLPREGPVRVAVFAPAGTARIIGTSGREYEGLPQGRNAYNLLAVSLDHGGAIRLFHPQVETVVFVDRWSAQLDSFHLFLPYQNGQLQGFGTGPEAARSLLAAAGVRDRAR